MKIEDLQLNSVVYFMQKLVITAGSVTFEVPRSMINKIVINKEYYSDLFPYYYLAMNVPLWFYSKIVANSDNISVSMTLQYRLSVDNDRLMSPIGSFTTELSGSFKGVISDTTQIADFNSQEIVERDSGSYNSNYTFSEYAFLEINLYNKAAYTSVFDNKGISTVLTSTNMTNAIAYCYSKLGINNVLMSKCDNNSTYREFKINKESGMKNMLRIVEDYNFHNDESIFFFDLNESYLITKKVGSQVWKTNENRTTHLVSLADKNDAVSRFNGVYINSQEKYNALCFERSSFLAENLDKSPYLESASNQLLFVTVNTSNALFSTLTPNKEFIFTVDTPEAKFINGSYKLFSVSAELTPSGEVMTGVFKLRFCR